MRSKGKKSLAFLVALVMTLSVFCGSGLFADAEETDGEQAVLENDGENEGNTQTQDTDVTSLSHEKYIKDNGNGTYDLTLTVSGASGSETHPQKLDVLIILDQSGSMKYDMAGTYTNNNGAKTYVTDYNTSRWYNAKLAINEFIASLEGKSNLDVMYSIVSFSGSKSEDDGTENDAWIRQPWSKANGFTITTLDPLLNRYTDTTGTGILDYEPSGGTNYQAGIRTGKSQLSLARQDAKKVVIFMSDGEATYYYDSNGKTTGTGHVDADTDEWKNVSGDDRNRDYQYVATGGIGNCSNAAYTEISTMTGVDYFYTIGLGNESAINTTVLTNLSSSEKGIRGTNASPNCTVKEASESRAEGYPFMCGALDDLKAAFNELAASITRFACTDVTVTDTLSENVDIIGTGTDGAVAEGDITIRVLDEKGEEVPISSGISARYDPDTKQVILDFPDGYQLEDGYTYLVTFKVQASDIAYQKYAEKGGYTDKGEEGTGETSADQDGFFSNDSAVVTYTYKEEKKTEDYNKPVIQLEIAKLTIKKEVTGLTQEELNDKTFTFTIESKISEDNEGAAISNEDYSKYLLKGSGGTISGNKLTLAAGQSATFVYRTGTMLTFTEDTNEAKVEGYDLTATGNGTVSGTMTVPAEEQDAATLIMTNAYSPSDRILTVKKLVSGNMGDTDREFAFTLTLEKDNEAYTASLTYTKNIADTTETTGYRSETGTLQAKTAEGEDASGRQVYEFTLSDGDSIELTIPYGCTYIIEEAYEDYSVKINGSPNDDGKIEGSLTEATTVTYQNEKEVVIPTGLTRTMAPYVIMCVIALAGIAVAAVLLLRRRRTWR